MAVSPLLRLSRIPLVRMSRRETPGQSFVSTPRCTLGQVGQLVRRTLQTRAAARPALPRRWFSVVAPATPYCLSVSHRIWGGVTDAVGATLTRDQACFLCFRFTSLSVFVPGFLSNC